MARRIRLVTVVAVVALVAGCTNDDATDVPATAPTTEVTTTVGAAATTAMPATTTAAPAPTTVAEPTVKVPAPGEPWDLVVIGTELDLGLAFLEMYADSASEVLGVDVNATYAPSAMEATAWQILGQLRGDVYPEIGGIVRQAEIVVVIAYPDNSDGGEDTHIDIDSDNCSYEVSKKAPKPPAPTTPEYWQPYTDLLDDIYTEIWSLRDGAPTVLIGPDLPSRFIGRQRAAGIDAECIAWVDAWSAVVRETAERHGAVFVSLTDALNGPNHDIDTFEAGYTGPSDEYPSLWWGTANEVGTPMIVDAMVAAGFESTTQP